jgi:predicted aldo/keto reductase-like oxidoreductase
MRTQGDPGALSGTDCASLTRRQFIGAAVAAGVVLGAAPQAFCAEKRGDMIYRPLGRTGEKISVIGLGGYHIGIPEDEQLSIRMMRTAIDRGITFMDNCWDYHDGKSEEWMGKALQNGYRDRVFLMSKIDGQTRTACAKQIDESLKRLRTDRVDLLQFHEVIRPGDPDKIFAEDGAIHAMLEARKAGKVRFIGFTGHKSPAIHLQMLDTARKHKVRMDAVQMPLNVMDAHFLSFEKEVLPVLVRDEIGVLAMKPLASGHILKTQTVKPRECLHYALNLPTSTVITGMDKPEYVDQALEAVRTFKPMDKKAVKDLLARTAPHAGEGKFEPFKTTTEFDGTVHNPHWLG